MGLWQIRMCARWRPPKTRLATRRLSESQHSNREHEMRSLVISKSPGFVRLLAGIYLLSLFASTQSGAAASTDRFARQIVENADRIRFPQTGYQVDIKITTVAQGQEPNVRRYRVLSKGNDKALIITTAPAIDRGQIMLMRAQELWIFMPNVSRSIRLPLSQKLTGQVSNGDLARANFSGDYNPKLLRAEKVEGIEYYVLELTAARRGVTYHRVLYWVDKRSNRPYKAEFYTFSKRLLKVAYYQKFKEMGGEIRPTRLVVHDKLRKREQSILDYTDMKRRKLADKIFTKQYLKKLR